MWYIHEICAKRNKEPMERGMVNASWSSHLLLAVGMEGIGMSIPSMLLSDPTILNV